MANSDTIQSDVGVIGLDVIGRNVAQRLAERDFNVAAYDGGLGKTLVLPERTAWAKVRVAGNVSELMAKLRQPRTILIFSGADTPLSSTLDQLLPELEREDLVVDAGNSYFKDTASHGRRLEEQSIEFMGIGLAGGEKEVRHGAIVMAGGARRARDRTRPWLETMAATVRGEPCVSYFDTAAAAHFVKMVHAGVEYALLQLLSEIFVLLQRTLRLSDEELHDASGLWLIGVLKAYLMEISGRVFEPGDAETAQPLLEEELKRAKSDALGKWLAQSAWELEAPIPTIEAAVGAERVAAAERRQALLAAPFRHPAGRLADDPESVLDELHGALHAAMMLTYAQGMALLIAASKRLDFQFKLPEILRAWRGCTHLRTPLLNNITNALEATPDLPGLLSDDDLSQRVMDCQENLRGAVWRAHELDTDVPGLLASLDYLDSNRAAWMPANLIQVPSHQPGRGADRNNTGR
jgi:6-phosphogluconate dehydrogenase